MKIMQRESVELWKLSFKDSVVEFHVPIGGAEAALDLEML